MRSPGRTVPATGTDLGRYLPGTESRIRGALEDVDRTGQGTRSRAPEKMLTRGLKLEMKIERTAAQKR